MACSRHGATNQPDSGTNEDERQIGKIVVALRFSEDDSNNAYHLPEWKTKHGDVDKKQIWPWSSTRNDECTPETARCDQSDTESLRFNWSSLIKFYFAMRGKTKQTQTNKYHYFGFGFGFWFWFWENWPRSNWSGCKIKIRIKRRE